MAEELNTPELSNLGSVSNDELAQALSGRPTPVQNKTAGELDLGTYNANVYNTGTDRAGIYSGLNSRPEDMDQYKTTGWDIGIMSIGGTQGLGDKFSYESSEQMNRAAAAEQTYLDQYTNALGKFVINTGINAAQGIGMIYGFGAGLVQGDLGAMSDNNLSQYLDEKTRDVDARFALRDKETLLSDGLRLTDDVLKGLSFISGAIATEAILSAVTVGTGGAGATVQAAATAGYAAKGAKLLKTIMNSGKKILSGNVIDDVLKGAALGGSTTATQAASALATGAAQVNRARAINTVGRVSRQLLTGAGMEAGMEARTMQSAAILERKTAYEAENGVGSFTPEMEQQFKEENGAVYDSVFLTNLALVGAGNALLIPRVFGVGLQTGMKGVKMAAKSGLDEKQLNRAAKFFNKSVADLPEDLPVDVVSGTRRVLAKSAYLRSPLYEGFVEEGGQSVISRTAENYIASKYDQSANAEVSNVYNHFTDSVKETYTTAEGLKEVGMGLLIGTMGLPSIMIGGKFTSKYIGTPDEITLNVGGKKIPYKAYGGIAGVNTSMLEEDERIRRVMSMTEKDPGTLEILRSEADNLRRQSAMKTEMSNAINNGEFKEAKDIESDMIFSHATSKIVTGRYDMAIEDADNIFRDMSVEEYRDFLGEDAAMMSDDEVRARKDEVMNSYKTRMARVKDSFEKAGKIYRGEDPEVHAGIAKLIYDVNDRDAREKGIADSIAKDIKELNGNQILDGLRLQQEFNISVDQFDELTRTDKKIKAINKQLETKKSRNQIKEINPEKAAKREAEIAALQEELVTLEDRKQVIVDAMMEYAPKVDSMDVNAEYTYDVDEFNNRLNVLLQMNDLLIRLGNTMPRADYDAIRDQIADLSKLVSERKQLIAAYNSLLEPGGYDNFINSLRSSIEKKITPSNKEKIQSAVEDHNAREAAEDEAEGMGSASGVVDDVVADGMYDFDTDVVVEEVDTEGADVVATEVAEETDVVFSEDGYDADIVVSEVVDDLPSTATTAAQMDDIQHPDAPEALNTTEIPPVASESSDIFEPTGTEVTTAIGEQQLSDAPTPVLATASGQSTFTISLTDVGTGKLTQDFPAEFIDEPIGKILTVHMDGETAVFSYDDKPVLKLHESKWYGSFSDAQIAALRNGYKLGFEITGNTRFVNKAKGDQRTEAGTYEPIPGFNGYTLQEAIGLGTSSDLFADFGFSKGTSYVFNGNTVVNDLVKRPGARVVALKETRNGNPTLITVQGMQVEEPLANALFAMYHTVAIYLGQFTPEQVNMNQGTYQANLAMLQAMPQFKAADGTSVFDQGAAELADALRKVFHMYMPNPEFSLDKFNARKKKNGPLVNARKAIDILSGRAKVTDYFKVNPQIYIDTVKRLEADPEFQALGREAYYEKITQELNKSRDTGPTYFGVTLWKGKVVLIKLGGAEHYDTSYPNYLDSNPLKTKNTVFAQGLLQQRYDITAENVQVKSLPMFDVGPGGIIRVTSEESTTSFLNKNFRTNAYAPEYVSGNTTKRTVNLPNSITGRVVTAIPVQNDVTSDTGTPQPPVSTNTSVNAAPVSPTLTDESIDALEGFNLNEFGSIKSVLPSEESRDEMDYNGDLQSMYTVPNLTAKEASDAINLVTGMMVQELVRAGYGNPNATVKENQVNAKKIYDSVLVRLNNELKVAVDKSSTANLSPATARNLQVMVESLTRLTQNDTYARVMKIAMIDIVNSTGGIVDISKKTFDSIYEELQNEKQQLAMTDDDLQKTDNPSAAFDSNFAFSILPHQATLPQLKLALMQVQHVKATRATVTKFGMLRFVNYKGLTQDLATALLGSDYTFADVYARLQKAAATKPHLQPVVKMLSEANLPPRDSAEFDSANDALDQLRNQFTTFAAKDPSVFISTKVDTRQDADTDTKPKRKLRMYSSNDTNMSQFLLNKVSQYLYQSGIYKYQEGIGFVVDVATVKKFNDELNAAFDGVKLTGADAIAPRAEAISKVLEKYLQVPIDPSIFDGALMPGAGVDLLDKGSTQSDFGQFRLMLRDIIANNNPMSTDLWTNETYKYGAPFRKMVRVIGATNESIIQNSSKDGSGKTRSHISNPKMLTRMSNLFKHYPNAGRERDNYLLQEVLNPTGDANLRKAFAIDYIDGIGVLGDSRELRDFHDMKPIDRALNRVSMFLNNNSYTSSRTDNNVPLIRVYMPTLSDKKTMPLLQVPMLKLQAPKITDEVNAKSMSTYTIDDFFDVGAAGGLFDTHVWPIVQKELLRVQAIRSNSSSVELMPESARKADQFILFPEMNRLLEGNMIPTVNEARNAALEAFKTDATRDLQNTIQRFNGTLYDLVPAPENQDNMRMSKPRIVQLRDAATLARLQRKSIPQTQNQAAMGALFAQMVMQNMVYNTLITDTYLGDLGQFWKSNVNKTKVNIGKRLAALIAPGLAIPIVTLRDAGKDGKSGKTNEFVTYLPLEDYHFSTPLKDYYKKLGLTDAELATYDLDSTDAAEFVMPEEHLGILYAQGRISKNEMNGILRKVEEGKALTVKEKSYFQPMKPVMAGVSNGQMLYVKSAQIPLVPDVIRGTELQKLYDFAKANGIDRYPFKTAVKIGLNNGAVKAFNDDGTINTDALERGFAKGADGTKRIIGQRRNMLIQQEVPVGRDTEKTHGSQTAKLFIVDLLDEKGFQVPGQPEMTGKQLYDYYMAARKNELNAKIQIFSKKYGYEVTLNPQNENEVLGISQTAETKKILAKRLLKEAIDRNYDINEIAQLRYDIENERFMTPLWANPSNERIGSLLLSIWNKEIFDSLMPGFSGPVVPEAGYKELSVENLTQEQLSGIVWTTDASGNRLFDGNKLKSQQVINGQLQPDQIILPWKFKGELEQFIVEKDGRKFLDMDKVPQELLQVFTYRIPSQKKASSSSMEIVGFLPKSMGDTIIPPAELVGRFGQDFDIDKMFGFMYDHEVVGDKLQVIRETKGGDAMETLQRKVAAARNQMLDVYHASMRNPSNAVQRAIVSPVTDGYGAELGEILEARFPNAMANLSLTTMSYNDYKSDSARSAKQAIGVFASANVLHAQLQAVMYGKDAEYLSGVFIYENESSKKRVNESRIGAVNVSDSQFRLQYNKAPIVGTISDQFGRLLNHAVDNENNQVLSKLGINEFTYNIFTVGTMLGLNQETLAVIAKNPVVKEYVRRLEKAATLTDRDYPNTSKTIMGLKEEFLKQLSESQRKQYELLQSDKVKIADSEFKVTKDFLFDSDVLDSFDYKTITPTKALGLLDALQVINNHGQELLALQTAMKLDTRSPKNLTELFVTLRSNQERIKEAEMDQTGLFYQVLPVLEDSVSGLTFTNMRRLFGVLIPNNEFPLGQEDFTKVYGNHSKTNATGTVENLNIIQKGVLAYMYAELAARNANEPLETLRAKLLLSDTENIASRLVQAIKDNPQLANNAFIQLLEPNIDKKRGYYTVEFVGDRETINSPRDIHSAALELANSNNPQIAKLFKDLTLYALMNGASLSSRSFIKYIPAEYLQEFEGASTIFNPTTFYNYYQNSIKQIIQHNPSLANRKQVTKTDADEYVVRSLDNYPAYYYVDGGYLNSKFEVVPNPVLMVPARVMELENNVWEVAAFTEIPVVTDWLKKEYDPSVEYVTPMETAAPSNQDRTPSMPTEDAGFDEGTPTMGDVPVADNDTIDSLLTLIRHSILNGKDMAYVQPFIDEVRKLGYTGAIPNVDLPPAAKPTFNGMRVETPISLDQFVMEGLSSRSDVLQELMKLHQSLSPDKQVKVVVNSSAFAGQPSRYESNTQTIYLSQDSANMEVDLIHELVHHFTVRALVNPKTEGEKKAAQAMQYLHMSLIERMDMPNSDMQNAGYVGKDFRKFQDEYVGWKSYTLLQNAIDYLNKQSKTPETRQQIQELEKEQNTYYKKYQEFLLTQRTEAVDKYYPFIHKTVSLKDGKLQVKEMFGVELVSHILSDKKFISAMSQIKSGIKKDKSLLDTIIESISKALKNIFSGQIEGTAAQDLVDATVEVIYSNINGNIPNPPKGNNRYQSDLNQALDDYDGIVVDSLRRDMQFENLPDDVSFESIKSSLTISKKQREVIIQYKQKRVSELRDLKARFANDKRAVNAIEQRLIQEQNELDMMKGDDSVLASYVASFAERELDDVRNLLSKVNVGSGNFEYALARVLNAKSVIDFYSSIRRIGGRGEDAVFRDLVGEANNLREDFQRVGATFMREALRKKYPEMSERDMLSPDAFEKMDGISSLSSLFMDASRQGRSELSYLSSLVKDSSIETMTRFNELMGKYDEKSRAFKDSEYFKKYGWEGLVVQDSEGNPTAELLSPLSTKFADTKNELLKSAKATNNYTAYFKWLNGNTQMLDVEKLFTLKDGIVEYTPDLGYLTLLEREYGKGAVSDMVQRQQKLYQDFEYAKLAYEDRVRMEESDPAVVQEKVDQWDAQHNPMAHLQYVSKGVKRPKGSSTMYVYRVPLKTKDGKDTGFYDARYAELMEDKAALDYYEFIRKEYRTMMSRLPMYSMNKDRGLMQMGLFIPAVKKSLMDNLWSVEGLSGKLNTLQDSVIAAMTSRDTELVENLIDPVTGKKKRSLPVYFMQRLKDVNEQEFDMDKVFATFSMMAISYDAKNKVQDKILMSEALLQEVEVYHTNGLGQKIMSSLGVPMGTREAADKANILRSVKAVVDSYYGENVTTSREGMVFGKKIYTNEEEKKLKEIESREAEAKAKYDAQEMDDESYQAILDKAAKDKEALGGRLDLVKGIRGMTWWTQLKGMAWNLPAAVTNSLFGPMSVYRHASGGRDFTIEDWRRSLGILTNSMLNNLTLNTGATQTKTATKIQNMMINMNVLKDFSEIQYNPNNIGQRRLKRKGIQKLAPYELQGSSEYLAYGNSTIAFLLNKKVDGVSLWDAMDENGIIQIDGYRPGETEFKKLITQLDQMNKLIHGNYDPDAPMPIKKTILGPLLMQFRTWLPEAAAQRFGGRKYDENLGRETEGTFVTMRDLLVKDWKGTLANFTALSLPIMHNFVKLDQLSELEQENLRKAAASMRMYLQLMLIAQLLRALNDDEDDEDAKYMFNFGLNIAGRLENDLRFFTNTETISDISGQQLLPIFGVVEELGKFGEATIETMMGEPTIETGVYAGDNKMVLHGSKLIPHTKAIQRIYANTIQEMQ